MHTEVRGETRATRLIFCEAHVSIAWGLVIELGGLCFMLSSGRKREVVGRGREAVRAELDKKIKGNTATEGSRTDLFFSPARHVSSSAF
jgi:hypothetical protein